MDGTGQPWEYLDGWAYRTDATGGLDTSTFIVSEWYFSGPNALDGETANNGAATPFPAGDYSRQAQLHHQCRHLNRQPCFCSVPGWQFWLAGDGGEELKKRTSKIGR